MFMFMPMKSRGDGRIRKRRPTIEMAHYDAPMYVCVDGRYHILYLHLQIVAKLIDNINQVVMSRFRERGRESEFSIQWMNVNVCCPNPICRADLLSL